MDNILTYLKWRGDLSFQKSAFHEVDALILSVLSYVEWDGIVQEECISLKQACAQFTQRYTSQDMKKTYAYSLEIPTLVKQLVNMKRFQEVKMGRYQNVLDEKEEVQFGAVTFYWDDNVFLSYRGTDCSMIGWKEDLNMIYMQQVPSQQLALRYLEEEIQRLHKKSKALFCYRKPCPQVYLGGHSKGGNLAMYAAICSVFQKDIAFVYNFDGPGFRQDFYHNHNISPILPKICTYLPHSSIIGRLLHHEERFVILKGYESGLSQHSAFRWAVEREGFQYTDALLPESDETKRFIEETLFSKTDEQIQEFANLLFEVLNKLDIKNINDLSELRLRTGMSGIRELSVMSSEERKLFLSCLRFIWKQTKSILFTKHEKTH